MRLASLEIFGMADPKETKDALKAALKEWMDEKLAEFGLWSVRAIAAAALVALTYWILKMNGWVKQ